MTSTGVGSWRESATAVDWNVQPFINGRYRPSKSLDSYEHVNPATETTLCRFPVGHAADIDEAVCIARQRFNDGCWSELPPLHRMETLLKLADLSVKHKADIALLD